MSLMGPFIILISLGLEDIKENCREYLEKYGQGFRKVLKVWLFLSFAIQMFYFFEVTFLKKRAYVDAIKYLREQSDNIEGINFYTKCFYAPPFYSFVHKNIPVFHFKECMELYQGRINEYDLFISNPAFYM